MNKEQIKEELKEIIEKIDQLSDDEPDSIAMVGYNLALDCCRWWINHLLERIEQ